MIETPATSFVLRKAPAARRRGTPRSRGACITCRRRRVKCNEEKPSCLRCTAAWIHCEGYGPQQSAKVRAKKAIQDVVLPRLEPLPKLTIAVPLNIIPTETEIDNRYLRHFQTSTESGFEGAIDWSLWNRLILQSCHHESFVRHSVVAIGAIKKSLESSHPSGLPEKDDIGRPIARLHREFALLRYSKAVKMMRMSLEISYSPRNAFLACLLVVCFETFLGNRHLVIAHARAGVQMLHKWVAQNRARSDTFKMLSPNPDCVEEEIVEAFGSLDILITTIHDNRSQATHETLMRQNLVFSEQMPLSFSNLDEARRFWYIVMSRTCHFLAGTWSSVEAESLSRNFTSEPPGEVAVTSGINIYSTSVRVTDAVRTQQHHIAVELSRWSQAFDQLFRSTRQAETSGLRGYVVSTLLRIHAMTTMIVVAGVLFVDETRYDVFYPQFEEMIHLIDIIVAAREQKKKYNFWTGGFLLGLGIIPPLFVIVMRCRDHKIRQRAIQIMRDWHLEACWDPRQIAEIGTFIMEIEEEGSVDGLIPEKNRAVFSRISENPRTQRALLQCVQKTGGLNGAPVWKEKMVTW